MFWKSENNFIKPWFIIISFTWHNIYLDDILIRSLTVSLAIIMSPITRTFSVPANLFETIGCYFPHNFQLFTFLRWNLSISHYDFSPYEYSPSLTFASTRHQSVWQTDALNSRTSSKIGCHLPSICETKHQQWLKCICKHLKPEAL